MSKSPWSFAQITMVFCLNHHGDFYRAFVWVVLPNPIHMKMVGDVTDISLYPYATPLGFYSNMLSCFLPICHPVGVLFHGVIVFSTDMPPRWGFIKTCYLVFYRYVTPMGFYSRVLSCFLPICHPAGVLFKHVILFSTDMPPRWGFIKTCYRVFYRYVTPMGFCQACYLVFYRYVTSTDMSPWGFCSNVLLYIQPICHPAGVLFW